MFYKSSSLDSNSNIILAGHNKKDIFSCLHKISINDSIKIITNKVSYNFKVIKKVIIDDTDYSYFNNKNEKILTLITCTNNNRKRLLVISKYSN